MANLEDTNLVLPVLTQKQEDNKPEIVMSISDMNDASDQPTDDSSFDGYTATQFDDAELIELHLDYWDADNETWDRIVDGETATWDNTAEEVSASLTRDDTARLGTYRFEWVLIYDTGATGEDDAADVDTIPTIGFFEMEVVDATNRNFNAVGAPDRSVGILMVEDYTDHVARTEPSSPATGTTRLYTADADNNLYVKYDDGTTAQIPTVIDAQDDGSAVGSGRTFDFTTELTASESGGTITVEQDIGQRLINSPNGHIENAILPDDSGTVNAAEISVPVDPDETLTVYRWGGYKIADSTAPTGLQVQLKDDGDTVQASANTVDERDATGITGASLQNTSGSLSIYKLAVENDTGSEIGDPGVGAVFGYRVA